MLHGMICHNADRTIDADKLAWLQSLVAQSERGLPSIVKMLSAADADVRCSAMWALSHLVNGARPAVCEAVMAALPWERFSCLLQDADSAVQVAFCYISWAMLGYRFWSLVRWSDARRSELKLLQGSAVQFAAAGLLCQGASAEV